MTEYTASIALAGRLIHKKGRAIIVRRIIRTPNENPLDPPTLVNEDYNVAGVFLFGVRENRNSEVVEQETEVVMISALNLPIVPTPEDVIVDGGVQRVILTVQVTKPGAEEILYKMELKQ